MSSIHGVHIRQSLWQSARRFRFVELFIKSTPVIGLVFPVYVTFTDILS